MAPALVNFLHYVHADLEKSTEDYHDDNVHQLQASVQAIKTGREMEMRNLVMEMLMEQERDEGRAEGSRLNIARFAAVETDSSR